MHEQDKTETPSTVDNTNKTTDASPNERPQLPKLQFTLIFTSIFLTTFLVALDGTIIATAIPTITAQFNSLADISWYNAAYLLTTCAFQLPFGRSYALLSTKWTYLAAVIIFEIGSIVCATAANSNALILGRAVAGVGGSGIFGGAFVIIAETVALDKRPIFTGILGATFGIASVVGPVAGGAFTTHVTWRWCFYINLPLGAIALAAGCFFLPPEILEANKKKGVLKGKGVVYILKKFDVFGTAILLPSLVCLLLALQWGGQRYSWGDWRSILLLVLFGVSILFWAYIQYIQGENATVPKRVVTQRTVVCASLYLLFGGAAFVIPTYYLPTWFQAIKQINAVQSGIHTLPTTFSLVISAIVSGGLVSKFGYYVPFMILGSVLMTTGAGLLSTLQPHSGIGEWLGYQIVFGAGIGMSLEQCNIAVQTVLPPELIPSGTSLNVFVRGLGGSIGASIGENIFEQKLKQLLSQKVPDLPEDVIGTSGVTNIVDNVLKATGGNREIVNTVLEAYNRAITYSFYGAIVLGGLTLFCSLGVEWKSVRKDKGSKGEEEASLDAEK